MQSKLGISGLDENRRVDQARFGISGQASQGNIAAVGIAGNISARSRVGVAGEIKGQTKAAFGIAGINCTSTITAPHHLKERDGELGQISRGSERLGDRAARSSWNRGLWFADFTYILTPFQDRSNDRLSWREGREQVFAPEYREFPLGFDCAGYRRFITGKAPKWSMNFDRYPEAIEFAQPDLYASWDEKTREESMKYLRELMAIFPGDDRMWPIFSIRWTWRDDAANLFSTLPGWRNTGLANLIPENRTQRKAKRETKETWARQAISNAILMAQDPDFRWMVSTFGKVMIGAMVQGPCPREARHLFAATLCKIFPEAQFWLLGQANFKVVNGLGRLGLLDQVWTDGSWWIKDATCERFAYVEKGLITMLSLESRRQQERRRESGGRRETFFTLVELMAANLRALLSAYEGLWTWPPPEPLPIDLMDIDQRVELKQRLQAAQMELGL